MCKGVDVSGIGQYIYQYGKLWDNTQTASTEVPEHNLEGQPPIIVLHSGVVKKVVMYTEYRHTSELLMPAAPRGQA